MMIQPLMIGTTELIVIGGTAFILWKEDSVADA